MVVNKSKELRRQWRGFRNKIGGNENLAITIAVEMTGIRMAVKMILGIKTAMKINEN